MASRAAFKLVAVSGQVLNSSAVYENPANFPLEREKLIGRIDDEKIKGVVFLTGDRHHTELSELKLSAATVYDLTVSPLTSSPHVSEEVNKFQTAETLVQERNFATLDFTGKFGARSMLITVYDASGKELWTRTIAQ